MTVEMDETFATALRGLLVEQVHTTSGRRSWLGSVRRRIAGTGALLVAFGGGGIAYATGAFTTTPSGGFVVTHLAPSVTVTGTGTEAVQLGPQPAGTNAIDLSFTCLSPGTFGFADESETCGGSDASGRSTATGTTPVAPGQVSTTVTAAPGARWRLTATYSTVTTSAWRVNASGQTYGISNNQYGTPDLIAVQATNGRDGYVYATQLGAPAPKNPSQAVAENNSPPVNLTVYKSDGKTPIGVFSTQPGPIPTQTTSTIPPTTPATATATSGGPTS